MKTKPNFLVGRDYNATNLGKSWEERGLAENVHCRDGHVVAVPYSCDLHCRVVVVVVVVAVAAGADDVLRLSVLKHLDRVRNPWDGRTVERQHFAVVSTTKGNSGEDSSLGFQEF